VLRDRNRADAKTGWGSILLLIAISAAVSSCGIPQIVVLEPATVDDVISLPATVQIQHVTSNDREDFLGYELFYKFYDPETSTEDFDSDSLAIENASPSSVLSVLTQRGYWRVSAINNTTQQPTIRVTPSERSLAFTITVTFPDNQLSTGEDALAEWSATTPNTEALGRDTTLFQLPETFQPNELDVEAPTDPDIPEGITDALGTLPMGMVVVAYGNDFTNGSFATVYSEPTVIPDLLDIFYQE
jgi:hypothetical protein